MLEGRRQIAELQETVRNLRARGKELDAAIAGLIKAQDPATKPKALSDAWVELRRVACKCPKHVGRGDGT